MDRSEWDHDLIDQLAQEVESKETELKNFINNLLVQMGRYKFQCDLAFTDYGKYERYDLEIFLNKERQERIHILKIEAECGAKQKDWKQTIPKNWFCLSLVTRKDYGKSDIFIKHNNDLTSLFAIDCRWLTEKINKGEIQASSRNHSLNMNTCSDFYQIPFKTARSIPDHIAICENNNFKNLKHLLNHMIRKKVEEFL